jgi:tRNA A37 threonylcarbamoyladenosine synthetase subunit TsaC/SUA5/YrdC
MDKDKVKKDEAYRFAKKLARKRGVHLRNYKVADKKIDGNYWIIFEREDSRDRPAGRDNLAVRVSKRGLTRVYR